MIDVHTNRRRRHVIRVDGSEIDLPGPLPMSVLLSHIGAHTGGTIRMRHLGEPEVTMICDDDGIERNLPINPTASALYKANCWPDAPADRTVVRGDVALVFDSDFGGVL